MDVFIEGLILTGEGMVAAFVVCIIIFGIARIGRAVFSDLMQSAAEFDEDDETEKAAAIAAAISFTMDRGAGATGIEREAAAEAWAQRAESDLPEGGEF